MGRGWFSCAFILVAALSLSAFAAENRRPNVVVILADDQAWGDLSLNGNQLCHTPNVDSLARDGAMFDRFYVCAVCAPTRAEFLTGRYHSRGGVHGVSTGQERLNTDEKTIAHAFSEGGYATGIYGKWHNGSQWPYHPLARGFQDFYGFTSGHWGEYFNPPLEHNGQFIRANGYIADDLTDHAIGFIEKNQAKPFFCYLAFNTPHSPFAVPQKYWDRFKDKPVTQRSHLGEREEIQHTRCVLAMSENIDDNVGRVLKRLDELKLADNTIVLYFSDNGPADFRWNGGMKGRKGTVDEGGIRVPMVIRWPGHITPGTKVKQIAGAIDLLPTLTSMAQVHLPQDHKPLDGLNMAAWLVGGRPVDSPERMIFSNQNGKISVRTNQYRLDPAGALFDMQADPGQTKDVAKDQPKVAADLTAAVAAWKKDVGLAGGGKRDDRPFPVGYSEFPMTPLPARDGVAHGTVHRSASAPNSSYFVNWTSTSDSMTWDVDVHTAGDYDVQIYYTCPLADAGSTIELSFKDSKLAGKVTPGWDPPLYTNQDTIPRNAAESKMKEFKPLSLGTIHLEPGRGMLTLRATEIPGKSVMDMRAIILTLKK